jgi:hypothetical protein
MPINEGALDRSAWQKLVGLSATDTIGFYGATPIAQRANLIQANSVVSVSSNITIAASLTAWIVEVTAT